MARRSDGRTERRPMRKSRSKHVHRPDGHDLRTGEIAAMIIAAIQVVLPFLLIIVAVVVISYLLIAALFR